MTYVLLRLQPAIMFLQIREVAKRETSTADPTLQIRLLRAVFTSSIVGLKNNWSRKIRQKMDYVSYV